MESEKGVDVQFLRELKEDFGFSPVVSEAIVHRAKLYYQGDGSKGYVGKLTLLAVSADEPAGKPIEHCKLMRITITLQDSEDREQDRITERRAILLRVCQEAYEQGALLSEEDLARILRCSLRTIKSDVKAIENKGIFIPLRGKIKGIGRGHTHKGRIVELYLRGYSYRLIKQNTFHSYLAIKRYIETFGRVVNCIHNNLNEKEIALLCNISEKLVKEYVSLYHQYSQDSVARQRIGSISLKKPMGVRN